MNSWDHLTEILEAKTEDIPRLKERLKKIITKMLSSLDENDKYFLTRYFGTKGHNERFVSVFDEIMGVGSGYLDNPPKEFMRK